VCVGGQVRVQGGRDAITPPARLTLEPPNLCTCGTTDTIPALSTALSDVVASIRGMIV
jgi:hypothetical protein